MADPAAARAFLQSGGEKLSARRSAAKATTSRSKAPTRKSSPRRSKPRSGDPEQWGTVEQAYRDGRKDERIHCMIESAGVAWCEHEECDKTFSPGRASSMLDYAHDVRRSQAQGYRPLKGGQNDARFRLLCRPHHRAYDGSETRFGE